MLRIHRMTGDHLVEDPTGDLGAVATRSDGWSWVDVAGDVDLHSIGSALAIDLNEIADLGGEAFPKTDSYARHRHMVLHAITFDDDRISTVAYHALVRDDLLVTIRSGQVYPIDEMLRVLGGTEHPSIRTPMELLARIAGAGSQRFPTLLESLDDRIEDLEERAMRADASVIGEAQALRRDVIVLRRVFRPQRDVIHSLDRDVSIDDVTRRAFDDVYDQHFLLIESLDAARALLGSVQDTHRGAIAERTNEVMKVLTVFSATLLPLTLIAGMWGMNLTDLPGESRAGAFWVLVGAMVVIVGSLWVYFVRRGFVGGPRLGRVPKAVGLTLAHLGTAPLRAVARPVSRLGTRIVESSDQNDRSRSREDRH